MVILKTAFNFPICLSLRWETSFSCQMHRTCHPSLISGLFFRFQLTSSLPKYNSIKTAVRRQSTQRYLSAKILHLFGSGIFRVFFFLVNNCSNLDNASLTARWRFGGVVVSCRRSICLYQSFIWIYFVHFATFHKKNQNWGYFYTNVTMKINKFVIFQGKGSCDLGERSGILPTFELRSLKR